MSKVYELDLHGKRIKRIEGFEKCKALRMLDLSCNEIEQITGLHSNQQLRELKLYGNRIECIQGLEKLQELCNLLLQHNKIKCVGRGLASLRKLKVLRLDHNCLSQLSAAQLAPSSSSLTHLDVSHNQLEEIAGLGVLVALEEVKMAANRLSALPSDLHRCKKLQELDISDNPIALQSLSQLKQCRALKILRAESLAIPAVRILPELVRLEELYLAGNALNSLQGLKERFPVLEVLDARSNQLSLMNDITAPLQGLGSLVELLLEGNEACSVAENYRIDVKSLVPQLETIDGVDVSTSPAHAKVGVVAPPTMRPLTPSTVGPSLRQMGQLLEQAELQLETFSSSLTAHFQLLLHTPTDAAGGRRKEEEEEEEDDMFPALAIKTAAAGATSDGVSAGLGRRSVTGSVAAGDGNSTGSRPSTRSGSRGRLQEALAFASGHFTPTPTPITTTAADS